MNRSSVLYPVLQKSIWVGLLCAGLLCAGYPVYALEAAAKPTQTLSQKAESRILIPQPLSRSEPSIRPESYRATKGEGRAQGGRYDYFDETGEQLTDGKIGSNDVFADLGRGRSYEWVGWGFAQPQIQFRFARQVSVKRVEIRFNRNDKAAVGLPRKVTINGVSYTINPNKIPDRSSAFLHFEGAFVGHQINIQFTRGKGWVLIDEVRFVDP